MQKTSKNWTRLGLGAAFASTLLIAGCDATQPESAGELETNNVAAETPPPAAASAEPAAQGGEGEGGVAITRAQTDPVVFNAALAITEAHILAARDAYNEGETAAATEMFAHPVSEVLFDMEPIFLARGVTLFDNLLTETSLATHSGETQAQISQRTDTIIAALREASTHAPDDGTDATSITAQVISDQIDRAATMFRIATESPEYEPYLDGYGFYKVAANMFDAASGDIASADPAAATAIQTALDLLAEAYPNALRPDALIGDTAEITVASSNVILAVTN